MPGGWERGWEPHRCGVAHCPAQEIPVPKGQGMMDVPLGHSPLQENTGGGLSPCFCPLVPSWRGGSQQAHVHITSPSLHQ